MKRIKKLIILIVVFIIFIAIYMSTSYLNPKDDATDESVAVKEIDENSIKQISWEKDGESITLVKKDDVWSYLNNESFAIDQSYPKSMLSAISNLKSSQVLSEAENLSEYGLDKPVFVISVLSDDDTTTTYSIGNMNETTNKYYLILNEDTSIYMVDSTLISAFNYKLDDLKNKGEK